jgi:hypothetical protein
MKTNPTSLHDKSPEEMRKRRFMPQCNKNYV